MQKMCLFAASVKLPHPPETHDPPRQGLPPPVLSHFQEKRPVRPLQKPPLRRAVRCARLHDVENEHAAGTQGIVYPMKELRQRSLAADAVERIVDAFTEPRPHRD